MKKLVGVFAAMAILGSGAALADDKTKTQQDTSAQGGSGTSGTGSMQHGSSMGGSGSTMGQSSMGQKELNGKVVKTESSKVFVQDAQGAVVPLDIDRSTHFTDPSLKKAKDLREGQEIRASFEVKETKNMAKSISLSGTGGAGTDVMSPDSSINQGSGTTGTGTQDDMGGTGGSGSTKTKDSSMNGTGSDKSTNPDNTY
ncbi:S1 domain-containing protein [Myxococcus stipitatus]|uniref:S1 domain-containing protein n=1 Tax=Myxococcus stipitatus TaxID=83455 RepID=UPI001F165D8C|nr:S1 domain-containing protein [Myxococcus stipitatus]MCE9666623.1 S1 domain-containing protein [Myxococcus stipitatus]